MEEKGVVDGRVRDRVGNGGKVEMRIEVYIEVDILRDGDLIRSMWFCNRRCLMLLISEGPAGCAAGPSFQASEPSFTITMRAASTKRNTILRYFGYTNK